ncbi:GTP-binding protein 10 like protein [Trachymyrmex septentrionalis]|uniref:GTP-binding protein 10 like protein n=1 Tax=Trachymyrmex septentrionalis TaxID=34720 RepID=A0A195FU88_9HYME|nr:PREDICTED: GTP-binding protein 10 homolog [Trachymyrmex septentrionalis]KYN44023.1 GTP-binding protein 10 like protein [Trachymyrmex septentrionalis]
MVFWTQVLLASVKKQPRKYLRSRFIDTLRLHVRGGTGGGGLSRYGGIGGDGGNIYLVAKDGLTLENVASTLKTKRIIADCGKDSSARGIIGAPGQDTNILVPRGILVYNQNEVLLGDLNEEDSKILVAKGGFGGTKQTGYCGLKGESQVIKLDLKLIADIGLVGFPNAGKSTFLAAVSNAKPKIASYPFTTIRPRLGIMNYNDFREITVADLPGLIEGAHMNIGMGHKFLKHIERTKLLMFIVDIQGFQLSPKHGHRSCLETVVLLNKEIEHYKPDLLKMPAVLIINKMDTDNADNILKEIKPALRNLSKYVSTCPEEMQPEQVIHFDDILPMSLISKDKNIQIVKDKLRNILDKYEERKHALEHGNLDSRLMNRINRQFEEHTPTVV